MTFYDYHTLINIALYDNLLSGMPLWLQVRILPPATNYTNKINDSDYPKRLWFFCVLSLITKIDKKYNSNQKKMIIYLFKINYDKSDECHPDEYFFDIEIEE